MTDSTFLCLYCGSEKPQNESSLEHAIPQFLGGNSAPKIFQIANVCKQCNNRLGLWVDAAYAKSWITTNHLAQAARLLCTKPDDPGLPLRCIGKTPIPNLNVPDDHVAEHWIGPSGETITWIRPDDERMNSYSGGNPIATKKQASVAYYFPVSGDRDKHVLGMNSFQRAMDKRKVRKIFGAVILDDNKMEVDPAVLGFDTPTADEVANREAIRSAIHSGQIQAHFAIDTKFDQRFMCKLALGIGYSLFGEELMNHPTAAEARRGLWPPSDGTHSAIRGAPSLAMSESPLTAIVGYPGGVTILVMNVGSTWSICLSIDEKLPFVIELGPGTMTSPHMNSEEGYALVLVPYLDACVALTAAELIAHKLGVMPNAALEKLDAIRMAATQFDFQLSTRTTSQVTP